MAAAILLPYDVAVSNKIPHLQSSEQGFNERGGHKYIESGFAELFNRHKLTLKFCLVLLHRHGSLAREQAMVDTNGTSVPWNINHTFDDGSDYQKWNGSVFPSAWLVQDGRLMPYEFAFTPSKSTDGQSRLEASDVAFLQDFVDFIQLHKLERVFGLGLLGDAKTKTLEITEGTANIAFPLHDERILYDGSCVQASWGFQSPDNGGPLCDGKTSYCFKGCLTNTHFTLHYTKED